MSRHNRPMSTYRKGSIWTLRKRSDRWDVVEATYSTPFSGCYADRAHAQAAADRFNCSTAAL